MLSLATTSLGASVPPLAATPPVFATDFYVGRQDAIAINQGGYRVANGVCCSMEHAAQCKLQGVNAGGDTYEQGSKERVRSDSARGSVVSWWGDVKKQFAIIPGSQANSTHKWACAQYCPLDGEYVPSLLIGDGQKGPFDKPKDKGQKAITQPKAIGNTTKVCENWQWTETILGVVPMQETNFYVDMSAKPAAPFFMSSTIKPFNNPIGEENSSFIGYKAMDVSDDLDIDPASVSTCAKSDSCDPPPSAPGQVMYENDYVLAALSPHVAAAHKLLKVESVYERAAKQVAKEGVPAVAVTDDPPQPNITFATDFTATENLLSVIAQGASHGPSGDPCCYSDSPAPQCQVQVQHQSGTRYLDVTNQRTRFEDKVGQQTVVDDYKAFKSMLINVTAGVETCQEYCPIDPDDKLEPFDPFDPFDKTKDLGKTTFEGKPAEHYQWKDIILKIIVMSQTEFYADITNPKAAVPLFSMQELTPFGQKPPIGTTNQTWSDFTPGPPDAKKFAIAGMATCPRSGNCGQQSKQIHRAALRQFHTFARFQEAE